MSAQNLAIVSRKMCVRFQAFQQNRVHTAILRVTVDNSFAEHNRRVTKRNWHRTDLLQDHRFCEKMIK